MTMELEGLEEKKHPSVPSNYVSLAHLKDRWLQQRQQQKLNDDGVTSVPNSSSNRTTPYSSTHRHQPAKNGRNAGSSNPERVRPKFQDMLNEADELARPKSIPTRTPSFRPNRRYQEVRDGRSAEVSEREPMGMQIQDKRNEADESTLPKSLPARAPPFRPNQAVRYGRSAEAKEPEAVETEMQAEVAQDERKTDESKKKMNEIDESTLPNSLPTRTPLFRHDRRYRPVRNRRSVELRRPEPVDQQIEANEVQDKLNEIDESTLPNSLAILGAPYQAAREGRSIKLSKTEPVEPQTDADLVQDKMTESDESTLPNSTGTYTKVFLRKSGYQGVSEGRTIKASEPEPVQREVEADVAQEDKSKDELKKQKKKKKHKKKRAPRAEANPTGGEPDQELKEKSNLVVATGRNGEYRQNGGNRRMKFKVWEPKVPVDRHTLEIQGRLGDMSLDGRKEVNVSSMVGINEGNWKYSRGFGRVGGRKPRKERDCNSVWVVKGELTDNNVVGVRSSGTG